MSTSFVSPPVLGQGLIKPLELPTPIKESLPPLIKFVPFTPSQEYEESPTGNSQLPSFLPYLDRSKEGDKSLETEYSKLKKKTRRVH